MSNEDKNKSILNLFSKDPETLSRYEKDSVYLGHPQYAYVAKDWQTTREILEYGNSHNLPITFCGSQTSMTGASVADEGLSLSLTNKNKILDIGMESDGHGYVICEPGVILGDLKRAVQSEGFFYPPDPTSYNEVQIGSTVATNATGEDTYKYGPTRRYVQELEVILPNGQEKILKRQKEFPHSIIKNLAGYYLNGEEIDEVVGSEGTLCLIKKLKLKLLKLEKDKTFILVLPFARFKSCIMAVTKIAKFDHQPKAIELIGPGATDYFQNCPVCPKELKQEKNFLYIKDEYSNEKDLEKTISVWFENLEKLYRDLDELPSMERIFVAQTSQQLSDLHECRHYVPLKVNEEYFKYHDQGGGKVGTDWWVPLDHLSEMMLKTYDEANQIGIPFLVFAHIGNGHPHWNFLTKNQQEKEKAMMFVKKQCLTAVQFGGGVAGEHGIGKIKRYLLDIQYSQDVLKKMVAVKEKWDPNWVFGRGNILERL